MAQLQLDAVNALGLGADRPDDIAGAGTDAKVYVNIMGSKGPSGEKHLNNPYGLPWRSARISTWSKQYPLSSRSWLAQDCLTAAL